MRARGVVGKRIVKIHQGVVDLGGAGGGANVVEALELEDGTLLVPVTIETELGDYAHEFVVRQPTKRKSTR